MEKRLLRDFNELIQNVRSNTELLENAQTTQKGGFHYFPFNDSIREGYLIIIGQKDTPYDGIPFVFKMDIPDNYPFDPPKLKYISFTPTKIHPNLYTSGMVCLSITQTYIGPDSGSINATGWSPSNTLVAFVQSISSIFNEYPLLNEPGETFCERTKEYNVKVSKMCRECITRFNTETFSLPPDVLACVRDIISNIKE